MWKQRENHLFLLTPLHPSHLRSASLVSPSPLSDPEGQILVSDLQFCWVHQTVEESGAMLRPGRPLMSINQTRNDRCRWVRSASSLQPLLLLLFRPFFFPTVCPCSTHTHSLILCWFMVYCSLLCFKVTANVGQTRPRGGVFQRTCQGSANTAASCRQGSFCRRYGQNVGLPITLQLWFMNYISSLRGDFNQ